MVLDGPRICLFDKMSIFASESNPGVINRAKGVREPRSPFLSRKFLTYSYRSATLSIPAQAFVRSRKLPIEVPGLKAYLLQSLYSPFVLNLESASLMEVIKSCISSKSKIHRKYRESLGCLIYNLKALEEEYGITLQPIQITDIFWEYFITFCQGRGLKLSTIETMCNQLRSILNWAVKYNAKVSPTYGDFKVPKVHNQEIALSADEISRIAYFDIDRYYAKRRSDFRETMHKVRDMFVLSCNLFQRYSDMVRIEPACFERNIFRITQQKTGSLAVVNIDRYAIDAKTTYRILEKYGHSAPYTSTIGNYNYYLHILMRDIGLDDNIRTEERVNGELVVTNTPKWKMISSHTARRSAITINVLRGNNIHAIKRCSGHSDLRVFDRYIRDE